MRTALTTFALFVLAFVLHYRVRGSSATKEELSTRIILDVVPFAIFFTVLFLYYAVRAPYLLYVEDHQKVVTRMKEFEAQKNGQIGTLEKQLDDANQRLREKPKEIVRVEKTPALAASGDDSLRRTIQQRLRDFITLGISLREGWSKRLGGSEEVQRQSALAIQGWHKAVEDYLKTISRSDIYLVRFQNQLRASGSYPTGINVSMAGNWDLLESDLARLNDFLSIRI